MEHTKRRSIRISEAAVHADRTERTLYRAYALGLLEGPDLAGGQQQVYVDALESLYGCTVPDDDPIRQAAQRIVSEAPVLSGTQLDQIAALLRGSTASKAVA